MGQYYVPGSSLEVTVKLIDLLFKELDYIDPYFTRTNSKWNLMGKPPDVIQTIE